MSCKNWQSGEDVQYTYDSLARLTKAETLGPDWGQSFGYDGWGNLLSKSVTKGSAPVMSVTADPATNRLVVSGMAYDANGNVTNMPGVGTLAYDARNRITGSGGVPTRGYDPGNRKIWWKDSNGITFVDYWLPNGEKLVTYRIDESPYYNNWQSYTGPVQFSTVVRNLYFAGRRVKVEGGPGAGWLQPDRLSSNARHHPYGEERGTSSTEYKFATYQREASGLDYALNRYYSSVYGRFLSSDPYRASGGPSDPGSWNRYAYVQGDPVNLFDPQGLQSESPEGPPPLTFCQTFPTHPDCQTNGPLERTSPPQPRALNVGQIRTILGGYAEYSKNKNGADCDALVNALSDVASHTDNPWDIVTAVNQLFPTSHSIGPVSIPTAGGTSTPIQIESLTSGYDVAYRDSYKPNEEQSHHFGVFFNLGVYLSVMGVPLAGNIIDLAARGIEFPNGITNKGDIALGMFAGNAGFYFGNLLTGKMSGVDHTAIGGLLSPMCDHKKP